MRPNHINEELIFKYKDEDLTGIISFPASEGLHPAVVLLHGSVRTVEDDPY
jgi:hypothetical protein